MKKLFTLFVCLLAGCLMGCVSVDTIGSDRVNPSDVYQSYAIFGNKKESKLYAFFRVGGSSGTTVELLAPNKVRYNGKTLTKSAPNILKGTSYIAEESGYQPSHEILFTNSGGTDYRYNLSLEAIEFQPKSPIVVKRSQSNYIVLNRLPAETENIKIVLSNEQFQTQDKNKVSIELPQTYDRSKNALVIAPETLKNFPAGTATLIMTASKSLSLKDVSQAGGDFTANYEAAQLNITIAN